MLEEETDREPSPGNRGPWWIAAAGGGGGIVAAVLQDHTLGWAILAAFIAWLVHNMVITWLSKDKTPGRR